MRLDGKVAIVTGAGSGNGRGIAIGLAEAGAAVCASDVNLATAQETVATIVEQGGRGLAVEASVIDRVSLKRMVEAVWREYGRLDVLVNNAGVTNRDTILEVSEAEWDRVLAVNLKGPLLCAQVAVPKMIETGGGSIINIVSTSAELVMANLSAYASSKGALKVLTKAMAIEFAPYNIRANGICPGLTPTNINRERLTRPGVVERELERIPLGRLGRPEDYVGPCVLLASEQSSWMTGSMLWVEGGMLSYG